MYSNSSMTVFRLIDKKYERIFIPKVLWDESVSSTVSKRGQMPDCKVRVFIRLSEVEPSFTLDPEHDIAVKGLTNFEFDNTDERTQSESFHTLRKECGKIYSVLSCDKKDFGSLRMRHFDVLLK